MPDKQKVSDLTLEQYHLGELSPRQVRVVRRELERDAILRGRLAEIERSDDDIRAAYPADKIVAQIRERALRDAPDAYEEADGSGLKPAAPNLPGTSARRVVRFPTLAWAIPVAAMAIALLSLPIFLRPSDSTRLKGVSPHLLVFRKTPAGAEELRPGSVARQGDVLQLSYVAGEARYGVIFSVDGRGTVTWHVPAGYNGSTMPAPALDPQGPVPLPSAYELDDAPAFERFFLVYSTSPFDVAPVARAAARASAEGSLALPAGIRQFSLLVRKQG